MGIIWTLIIGGLAGWLAGKIMKGEGYGIIVDIIIGIVGGWLGGWVFGLLNIEAGGLIGELITAVVGAIILIWIIHKIKK